MSLIRGKSVIAAAILTLSIAARPNLVNGEGQSLSSVNPDKSSTRSSRKDSARDGAAEVNSLIEVMLREGVDIDVGSNLAPIIGLPKPMPSKMQQIVIKKTENGFERRACYVIYEAGEGAPPGSGEKRAVCAYIVRSKRSGQDHQTRYFRVDLTGKLEKAILSRSKFDESGKVVRGSGVKLDEDIDSPEVRKTFDAEMKFWLKDWLKKQPKAPAKKA